MFNIKQFLEDYNIPYWADGNNVTQGWLNIQCPFCDDSSNHGGFNFKKGYYNCWNCNWHSITNVIINLLNCSYPESQKIINQYETITGFSTQKKIKYQEKLTLPKEAKKLKTTHKKYLESRNFDPNMLEKIWGLLGTNHIGDYKNRIIAPVFLNNKTVSYLGRDVTGKSSLRYKTCKKENEVIHHKHTLYGLDYLQNEKAILVEGITDAWRLGKGAIALFGLTYTPQQILKIIKKIKTVFIILDKKAQKQALKLHADLVGFMDHIEIIELDENDPAEMKQEEANYLKKNLIG